MAIAPQQELRDQFAKNLHAARMDKGLSQQDLAKLCDINRTEISLFERSERSPRLDMIVILSRALQISPEALLEGIE